jgi:hypothetical protein
MQHYSVEDFLTYFGTSWFLHPNTGEVVQAVGRDREDPERIILSTKEKVKLSELDWKHVAVPILGYRSLFDGKALYYIARRAGRRTQKGVTPHAITITIPPIIRELASECGWCDDVRKHATLDDRVSKLIWKPEYVSLADAINNLKNKKHAIGYALSPNWAVTLGLYKDEPFLLHFKNLRVGGSKDGETFTFYDKDSEKLFNQFMEAA